MYSILVACLGFLISGAVACTVDDFAQAKTESEGVYVNCEHLDKAFGLDLDACMALTCQVGGNAFNFRISPVFITQCYPKKCCDAEPVYAGHTNGGYNVYLHNVPYYGCPLSDVGVAADVVAEALTEENTGEVTPEGCKWRGDVHPAGETWIQDFANPDKHKECECPDPLPEVWTSLTACKGACFNGDIVQYGGDKYKKVVDGTEKRCRCNTHGRERCR